MTIDISGTAAHPVERMPAAGVITTPALATPRSDAATEQARAGHAAPSRDRLARAVAELNR